MLADAFCDGASVSKSSARAIVADDAIMTMRRFLEYATNFIWLRPNFSVRAHAFLASQLYGYFHREIDGEIDEPGIPACFSRSL